jgi:hypothetical protein
MPGKISKEACGHRTASFLGYFDEKFAPLLEHRSEGFRAIFGLLEARCATREDPVLIVETGSMREPGNWVGDGQSTFLWNEFGGFFETRVHTIDLDPQAAAVVRQYCCDDVQAHTGDSIALLYEMAKQADAPQIDLLYLDSLDYDVNNPFPCMFHYIMELIAVRPRLGKGSIVAVDDNYFTTTGAISGNGMLVKEWFDHLHIPCVHQGHQLVWQL